METEDKEPEEDDDSVMRELATMVASMAAQRDVFQTRARAWISSPGFEETYDDLHPGMIGKIIVTLMGAGKSTRMRSSKLKADYQRLATEGELLFAGIIIGNTAMSEQPHVRYPAAVVAGPAQDTTALMQIGLLSHTLAELYGGAAPGSMPQCQRLIADDTYHPLRRRPLPPEETGGLKASLYDVRFSALEILEDSDAYPFVPLLIHPSGGPFVVVPWAILHGRPMPSRATTPPPLPTAPPPLPKRPPGNGGHNEISPGGSPIFRHQPADENLVLADMSGNAAEIVGEHVENHIGKIETVFHELVSHRVHLDVHYVPPTPERPFYTLVTSGMSDLPMTVPPGAEEFRYAELMLCLPSDWNLGLNQPPQVEPEAFKDERNYWPIRWLKQLARLPHEYNTWLGPGHTIPNGDPAESLAEGLPFSGFMICPPITVPEAFHELRTSGKTIRFHAILPLTTAEMNFKLQHGADALFEKLDAHRVSELVNPSRKSVV